MAPDGGRRKIHDNTRDEGRESMTIELIARVAGIVALGCFASFEARAQTVILPATHDAWLHGLSSTTTTGNDITLGICPGANYWIYLKFDLSGIAGDVVSAELRMTRFGGDRPGEISAYLIQDDSWNEATLTGPTRPAPTDPPNSSQLAVGQLTPSGYDVWASAALSAAISQEAQGDRVLSLMVRENTAPMTDIRYYRSKEAAVPSANKPQIVLSVAPYEVSGLGFDAAVPAQLRWTSQGSGVVYDIVTGTIDGLRAAGGVSGGTCLSDNVATNSYTDSRANPPAGQGDYYLVRGQSSCCSGTYGHATAGAERLPSAACP